MKNYTIRKLPEDLHRSLKILGAENDKTIQDLIIEALEQFVKRSRAVNGTSGKGG